MIIKMMIQCLSLVLFGFFSYLFFSKILGVKKSHKIALTIIVIYLIFIDYIFLGRVMYNILVNQVSSNLGFNLIYFFQTSVSQICLIIIVIYLFKGDILKKIAVCTTYLIIWQLVEYAVTTAFQRGFDLIAGDTQGGIPLLTYCLIELIRYAITCFLLYIIPKKCGNLSYNLPKKMSIFIFIPSIFILFISEFVVLVCNQIQVFNLLYNLEQTPNSPMLYKNIDVVIIFVIAVMGLCVNLIIVFGINNEVKQLLTGQQLEMQISHYQDLEANNEKMRSFRHDMKNHMITILGLLKANDTAAAEGYMSKLINESGLFLEKVQSGNKAVDALLSTKFMMALNYNVAINCDIKVPELVGVSDFDLCTILGNSIDNALEACQRVDDSDKRFISIQSSVVKSYFLLQIKNSTDDKEMSTDTLKSKKEHTELHGIGVESIKAAILKSGGMMDINLDDYIFSLSVMLPIGHLEH